MRLRVLHVQNSQVLMHTRACLHSTHVARPEFVCAILHLDVQPLLQVVSIEDESLFCSYELYLFRFFSAACVLVLTDLTRFSPVHRRGDDEDPKGRNIRSFPYAGQSAIIKLEAVGQSAVASMHACLLVVCCRHNHSNVACCC
jgi:hypothetical protein